MLRTKKGEPSADYLIQWRCDRCGTTENADQTEPPWLRAAALRKGAWVRLITWFPKGARWGGTSREAARAGMPGITGDLCPACVAELTRWWDGFRDKNRLDSM